MRLSGSHRFLGMSNDTEQDGFLPARWTVESIQEHGLPWVPQGLSATNLIDDIMQLGCAAPVLLCFCCASAGNLLPFSTEHNTTAALLCTNYAY